MDIVFYLFVFFVFLIASKWMVFILLSPLIMYKNSRLKSYKYQKKNLGDCNSNKVLNNIIVSYFLGLVRYFDIQVGMVPSHHLRKFIYKYIFKANLAPKVVIYYGAEIRKHNQLTIGEGSVIGDHAILDARNSIEIGENVVLASNVSIWTEQHDHRDPYFNCNSDPTFGVKIANRVWIGPNVIILHGVHIGEGAVIGAGAVVTKDIPAFTIAVGIPAKVVGSRNRNLEYNLDGSYSPFY